MGDSGLRDPPVSRVENAHTERGVIDMPTKRELEEQVENLQSALEAAYDIIGEALDLAGEDEATSEVESGEGE